MLEIVQIYGHKLHKTLIKKRPFQEKSIAPLRSRL